MEATPCTGRSQGRPEPGGESEPSPRFPETCMNAGVEESRVPLAPFIDEGPEQR